MVDNPVPEDDAGRARASALRADVPRADRGGHPARAPLRAPVALRQLASACYRAGSLCPGMFLLAVRQGAHRRARRAGPRARPPHLHPARRVHLGRDAAFEQASRGGCARDRGRGGRAGAPRRTQRDDDQRGRSRRDHHARADPAPHAGDRARPRRGAGRRAGQRAAGGAAELPAAQRLSQHHARRGDGPRRPSRCSNA